MKKFILVLTFLVIYQLSFNIKDCKCQWVQYDSIYGGYVYSLATSGNNIFAGTISGVWLSTNNSQSWTQTALNSQMVLSLATSGNNIFAGTNQTGIYLSTNCGQTWTQTALNNKSVRSFAISGNYIFAGTMGSVYLSTNNCQSWTQTALNYRDVTSLVINGNNIFAGTDNGIYLSTNNGDNWTQKALINITVRSLAISGNNIFAGTFQYGVYLSTNNGQSWVQTGLNNKYVYSFFISGNNVFAGCGYAQGVYLSTNSGQNWIEKNQGWNVIPDINNALLIANNYIYAGTYGQSVWRRAYSEIIGIQSINTVTPSEFSLSQNYPNPFNPATNIHFALSKNGFVKLKVYDILGKEIATLVNEKLNAGIYEVPFSISQFSNNNISSRIYFYIIEAGDFKDTKRMVLIK
jgi:hypothetical protein